MIPSTAFWMALAAAITGGVIAWANPQRALNRALAGAGAFIAVWLLTFHFASLDPEAALGARIPWALGGFLFVFLRLAQAAIVRPEERWTAALAQAKAWLFWGAALAGLTALDFFVTARDDGRLVTRPGYYVYLVLGCATAIVFAGAAMREMRGLCGSRRVELQVLVLGATALAAATFGVSLVASSLHELWLNQLMPVLVVFFFSGTAWALASTRVLDARHILMLLVEKTVLVAAVAVFVWGLRLLAEQFVPDSVAFVLAVGLGLWIAAEMSSWLQPTFKNKADWERVRRAARDIARKELRPEAMEDAFVKLLKAWAGCDRAVILMSTQGRLAGSGLEFLIDSPEMKTLHALRWASPERLARERPSAEFSALQQLLLQNDFGVATASAGPSLAFVVALGVRSSRRSYVFPEITRLLDLSAIFESALSRAHYLMKAQHAEQLATVGLLGASIAHEIRNPLVSIKTFVQLLPNHHQDPLFRDKFFRLIGDEVGRIDRLTEQLLDLAAPRVFAAQEIGINSLIGSCLELIAAKAEDKGVGLISSLNAAPDVVYTDPNAVKQVVLNLGFNAIQALEQCASERWIRFETRQVTQGIELTVEDNGPGIAPEVWARLFQPFQSTKSSGFGLGLAICKDILSSLHASITADPPVSGNGATFRIILPCQPPSS
jgi:signal transduction histidine kinase